MPDINKLVEQIYAGFERYVWIHETISDTLLESRLRGVLLLSCRLKFITDKDQQYVAATMFVSY
ncbi:hypothetical protein CXF56_11170 [Psychrobacter sp. Choline-02u-13]|uniref:hypothetical protein n=1 Tax=Psychrobacter sp. Choline-02u-9 TaxID=2058310 RepID=UPI000C7B0CA3|nr:hypothetical protein [Psychrobacter sp. Choline-02u-9]PKG63594.1 hypothetical protein CXF56_11170 [Psychrobacter sp. Choline-02u-13]PKH53182.1 hypothetical protein CXF69_08720 [Psychrobacter sp. Choline-02u-9]